MALHHRKRVPWTQLWPQYFTLLGKTFTVQKQFVCNFAFIFFPLVFLLQFIYSLLILIDLWATVRTGSLQRDNAAP